MSNFWTAAGLVITLPDDFDGWTIRERVLYLLREAFLAEYRTHNKAHGWLTTSDFLKLRLYSFRNRIDELGDDGYNTDRERVRGCSIWRYRLKAYVKAYDRQAKLNFGGKS